MGGEKNRVVVFFKNYFDEFFKIQNKKTREKIIWTLSLIEELPVVPEIYLKHITGTNGLYEIRIQQGSDIYRIICFFDKNKLVVLVNGFRKKTQETPRREITKALKLKEEYENEKANNSNPGGF